MDKPEKQASPLFCRKFGSRNLWLSNCIPFLVAMSAGFC